MRILFYIFIFNIITIILTMWINATNIIYSPIKNKYSQNNFLEIIEVKWVDSEFMWLDIIIKLYKNCVFSIMYYRVSIPGRIFKYCSLQTIWIVIVWSLFNIFKFIILCIKFIILRGRGGLYDFFYSYYNNKYDTRKMLFIKNEWVCNPNNYQTIIDNMFIKNSNIQYNNIYHQIYCSYKNILLNYVPNTDLVETRTAINIYKGKRFWHLAVWDPTGMSKTGYGYFTQGPEAIRNNMYKNEFIMSRVTGEKKNTIFLHLNKYIDLEPSRVKISYSDLSVDLFKNHILIEELGILNLPVANVNIFDVRIKDEVGLLKHNWAIMRKKTVDMDISDVELLQLFLNSIKINSHL